MAKTVQVYQFQLQPTKAQLTNFKGQLEAHRQLYNQCLDLKNTQYHKNKTYLSCFDLIKSEVPKFKGSSNYSALQQTVRRLDKAFAKFFRKEAGLPRFKSKNTVNTIEFAKLGDGCKLHAKNVYIQGLGLIKAKFHREIPTHCRPKTLSITLNSSGLFVNVICECLIVKTCKHNKAIGIDFGLKSTITLSDGTKVISPHLIKPKLKNLAKLNRQKSRLIKEKKTKKLSHYQMVKYNKIKKAISHIYAKIANKRKDFNHKLSRNIVNTYSTICLEDLLVEDIKTKPSEKMTKQKSKNINRRLQDIAIDQLKTFICYKAENAGSKVILVDPAYTTQICSNCGQLVPKTLKERIHKCHCGLVIDRDENAALNILRLGLKSLDLNLCI